MLDIGRFKSHVVLAGIILAFGTPVWAQLSQSDFILTDQGRTTTGDFSVGAFPVSFVEFADRKNVNVVVPVTDNTGRDYSGIISVNVFIPTGSGHIDGTGFPGYSDCISIPLESFKTKPHQEVPLTIVLPNFATVSSPVIQAFVTPY